MDAKKNMSVEFPKTLVEAVRVFSNLDYATMFFAATRWPDGVTCPHCGSKAADYIASRRVWECRGDHAKRQFSVKVGTIFEESKLTIDKCLIAVWLEVNAKNSISSYEVARHLGVTQKTGWFLLHRVRLALKEGSFTKPSKMAKGGGIIEADETYVGGLAKNMHKAKREQKIRGQGYRDKTAVVGLLERHSGKKNSTVRTTVFYNNPNSRNLTALIRRNVSKTAQVFTDAHPGYLALQGEFAHQFVDHTDKYVDGIVHTNGIENFWALFKRCIKGTHISVEPFHLQAYLDSEAFRFNNRDLKDGGRFLGALGGTQGKRLTYRALIGRDESEDAMGLLDDLSDKDAGSAGMPN